jgi:hypothetical protein
VIRAYEAPVRETVELGRVSTDAEAVQRYWRTHGLSPADGRRTLPLGLALALRGGPLPAVELNPRAVSFHAGHSSARTAIRRRPHVTTVRARIAEVFEKSGRSGPHRRRAHRRAVRRRRRRRGHSRAADRALARTGRRGALDPRAAPGGLPRSRQKPLDLDIGSTIAALRRRAPGAQTVHSYADRSAEVSPLPGSSSARRQLRRRHRCPVRCSRHSSRTC